MYLFRATALLGVSTLPERLKYAYVRYLFRQNIQVSASAMLLLIVGNQNGGVQVWGDLQWCKIPFELHDCISSVSRRRTCGRTFVQTDATFRFCFLFRYSVQKRRNNKAVSTRTTNYFKTGRESTPEMSFI